jgi:dienelactone hydrolase
VIRRSGAQFLAAATLLVACGRASTAAPVAAVAPPVAVTFVTRTFVDSARVTPAHGGAPELPSRTLPTTIAVPDGPGPFPLIMFSHGFGSSGQDYADLLRAIASAGYVVAAPDFPVTSEGVPGGPERGVDAPDAQPADVRFVIDQLLADPLAVRIDPRRIGAAGHSMGAGITMGVAFNTCCRDERIGAGVLMAVDPPTLYHGDYFVPPAAPVLVIHGDRDESLPYAGGRRAYETAGPPKFFLTVLGGDHSSAASNVVMAATVDFFDTYLKKRPDGLKRLKADADRPGVTRLETALH